MTTPKLKTPATSPASNGSTRFVAECHYSQTAPAYSQDSNGISWTHNRDDAHRFRSKAAAMAVAVAQALSSRGEAQVSNDQAERRRAARSALLAVSEHPYDRGYWSRYNGLPMPKKKKYQEGWKDCDKELAAESRAQHNDELKNAGH